MKHNTSLSLILAALVAAFGFFATASSCFADTTVGTPITKLPFTIKKPGKYRLIKSLKIDEAATTTAGAAITVPFNVEGSVTIDLNGFTITGPNTVAAIGTTGIYGSTATTVRNGSIFGFGTGVFANVAEDITVRECLFIGIASNGFGASIRRCRVFAGFTVSPPDGSLFAGISAQRADIADCSVHMNRTNDTLLYGIIADQGSTVRRCTARWELSGSAGSNTASAFRSSGGALVENCMAYGFRHGFDGASMRVQHSYATGFTDAAITAVDLGAGNNF